MDLRKGIGKSTNFNDLLAEIKIDRLSAVAHMPRAAQRKESPIARSHHSKSMRCVEKPNHIAIERFAFRDLVGCNRRVLQLDDDVVIADGSPQLGQ